jgi:hypothetical protein
VVVVVVAAAVARADVFDEARPAGEHLDPDEGTTRRQIFSRCSCVIDGGIIIPFLPAKENGVVTSKERAMDKKDAAVNNHTATELHSKNGARIFVIIYASTGASSGTIRACCCCCCFFLLL